MRRTEPGTATVALALGVGLSALGKSLGLPPMPPGLLQPLAPVASVVGQEAVARAARTSVVALIALAPAWAWVAAAPFDSGFDASDVLEGGTAAMVSFLRGIAPFLLAAGGAGAFVLCGRAPRTAKGGRNALQKWIARACAVFKRHEAPRGVPWAAKAARPRGAASKTPKAGAAPTRPRPAHLERAFARSIRLK